MEKIDYLIRMYDLLENDTHELGQTIQFDQRNLSTFGMRIYILFFSSCNLFEALAKGIAEKNTGKADTNMNDWKQDGDIYKHYGRELIFRPMGFSFKPLENLGEEDLDRRVLSWWQNYNDVKHDLSKIDLATLKNLIFALASAGILIDEVSKTEESSTTSYKLSKLFHQLLIPDCSL